MEKSELLQRFTRRVVSTTRFHSMKISCVAGDGHDSYVEKDERTEEQAEEPRLPACAHVRTLADGAAFPS